MAKIAKEKMNCKVRLTKLDGYTRYEKTPALHVLYAKTRGEKMNPTNAEKAHWDRVASLGCIACLIDGYRNPLVSIHHVNGRTKKGAHMQVLGLCAAHHQDGTGNDKNMIAIHPFKRRFEQAYGTQQELLIKTNQLLQG